MVIGITGGIGAGKSTVLNLLKNKYGYYIFEADQVAHELMKPGQRVYEEIVEEFGKEILDINHNIDRKMMAKLVFSNEGKLEKLNSIVHPAVIEELKRRMMELKKHQGIDHFVIEAALLIESGCNRICDTVWYIYADENVRIKRLIQNRNMTEEQIRAVMKNQLNQNLFSKGTQYQIDNSYSLEDTDRQIEKLLVISDTL